MVKTLECGILVSKFELHLRNYNHFQTNTLGMNPHILLAMN